MSACRSHHPHQSQAEDAGMQAGMAGGAGASVSAGADAAGQSGAAGTQVAHCEDTEEASVLGIASVPLNAAPPLQITETVQLLGDGVPRTLMAQQNIAAGLHWKGERMFITTDPGFWDIGVEGSARWHVTNSTIVWGLRSGDLDGDGDQDIIVLTMEPSSAPNSNGSTSPFVYRLTAWDRTSEGLMERGEVMRTPESRVGMPYVLCDLDNDGDLDVVGFEKGAPSGYRNDGAFMFSRATFGEVASELVDTGILALDCTDRSQDGSPDLLMVAGNFVGNQLENSMLVLLGDGTGKFGAPGPATKGETPLVPHGPDGLGLGIADVTGDGLPDVIAQDAQSTDAAPILRLYASTSATSLSPAVLLEGLGFEFADVDEDGRTDIVTTLNNRLVALLADADCSAGRCETQACIP